MGSGASRSGNTETKVTHLNKTPFFVLLEEQTIRRLAKSFALVKYKTGDRVQDRAFTVVVEGELSISTILPKEAEGGGTQPVVAPKQHQHLEEALTKKLPGSFFSKAGSQATSRTPKVASRIDNTTTTAMQDSTVMSLEYKELNKFLKQNPSVAGKVKGVMGDDLMAKLKKMPFFQGVEEAKLRMLVELFNYHAFEQGDTIFSQGDTGEEFYVVVYGSIRVEVKQHLRESKNEKKVVTLGDKKEGTFFGEIALTFSLPRTATVIADAKTLLVSLKRNDFNNFLKVAPTAGEIMKVELKRRLIRQLIAFEIPFFQSIPEDTFMKLADLCRTVAIEPNQNVCVEGEGATGFFILMYGRAEVVKANEHQCFLEAGSYFGEISMFRGQCAATVKTATSSVLITMTKTEFRSFFASTPELLNEIEFRILGRYIELQHLLKSKIGYNFFYMHMKKELSEEHVDFWAAVEEYKETADLEKRKEKGQQIIDMYVTPGSERQVNLKDDAVNETLDGWKKDHGALDALDKAQAEIYFLLEKDSFARFKKTEDFTALLATMGVYDFKDTDVNVAQISRSTLVESTNYGTVED